MNEVHFYCLNFQNAERKLKMQRRFGQLGVLENCTFYDGVSFEDERIDPQDVNKRATSCCYGHLDMIRNFYYNSNYSFGIFCEDDIFIRKELKEKVPTILANMRALQLDVLLLGYLCTGVEEFPQFFSKRTGADLTEFSYYEYPFSTWGTQMYILTRPHAAFLLEKYTADYIRTLINNSLTPFSADFIFTKEGDKRALIRPIMAIEDNPTMTDYSDIWQQNFHLQCFHNEYKPNVFVE
jgi:hypothetical protein